MRKKLFTFKNAVLILVMLAILAFVLSQWNTIGMYYLSSASLGGKELSEKWGRSAFEMVTDYQLPSKTRNLHTFFGGGHDPAIIVKFEADVETIERFLQPFIKGNSHVSIPGFGEMPMPWGAKYSDVAVTPELREKSNTLGYDLLRVSSLYKEKLENLEWWNPKSVQHGRLIKCVGNGGYKILIDEKRNIVYLFAFIG